MTAPERRHDVLIVGAGPVGLALLLDLRRRGVDAVALDRDAGPSAYPKARVVSSRSMELLRRWGLAEPVHAAALKGDWTERIVVGRSLAGEELLRVESDRDRGPAGPSPESRVLCTQDHLERILADRAALLTGSVLWRTEARSVLNGSDGALVRAVGPDGEQALRAAFVVLADGSRGLGAGSALPGAGQRRAVVRQVSFLISTDLSPWVAGREAFISYLVDRGLSAQLLAVDGKREWVVSTMARRTDTAEDFPAERVHRILASVFGLPPTHPAVVSARIRDIRLWDIATRVADRFADGRVVRAGDAAHELPPTGAMGLNLGLVDADALSWRLAAMLAGWGADALLQDYDTERRAVALRTARWSRECFNTVAGLLGGAARGDADAIRASGSRLSGYLDSPGLELGPMLWNGIEEPAQLVQDGRPGSRAPHLAFGPRLRSTLDDYGTDPVLLLGESDRLGPTWAAAAARRHRIPLRITPLPTGWAERHGVAAEGAVLVRPDGYVSWRSGPPGAHRGWDRAGLESALLRLAGRPRAPVPDCHTDGAAHPTP